MTPFIIANWKTYLSHTNSIALAKQYVQVFKQLAGSVNIVICPSFESLSAVNSIIASSNILLGAQNCAPELHGAYTGMVGAANLAEVGCTFCIVGHAEQRALYDNDEFLQKQIACLLDTNITPVICIGESRAQQQLNLAQLHTVICNQLKPIKQALMPFGQSPVCIAYEPGWAIGSTNQLDMQQLQERIRSVYDILLEEISFCQKISFLYGGSVTPEIATDLSPIKDLGLNGFLVGRASTDFQLFQKIVSSVYKHGIL